MARIARNEKRHGRPMKITARVMRCVSVMEESVYSVEGIVEEGGKKEKPIMSG